MIDKRIYMLTIIAFVVGMSELIVGGILDLIANDLHITVSQAGLLISIFSLFFGLAAPILLYVFKNMERRKLMLIALFIFLLGNIVAVLSNNYGLLMVSRVVSAISGSLVVVLCINMASHIADVNYRGRSIGLVIMGISGSLVLGLPIGVVLGNAISWRAPFAVISLLTLCLLVLIPIFVGKAAPKRVVSIATQIKTLANKQIAYTHLTVFFFITGHYMFYSYLTPYTKTVFGFSGMTISLLYFIFGIAAVSGGGLAGFFADRIGIRKTVLSVTIALGLCLLLIPLTENHPAAFWFVLVIWGLISWGMTPPMQSHLMLIAPETSDIQQSLNNSALHFGIAAGALLGGIIVNWLPLAYLAYFGVIFIALSFMTARTATNVDRRKLRQSITF